VVAAASENDDALALVLEGSVGFAEGDPKKSPATSELKTWGALRAPGAGYYLQARGGRASVLMVLTARTGTLSEAIDRARQKAKTVALPAGRLETSDLSSLPKFSWGGGAYHARIAFGGSAADRQRASL